ncbi:MAG TPA: hypothetical protein VFW35_05930 [Sphingomicrobium sp.]|nr:hypothetical protein [Sphingomicrobium sp.]
MITEYRGGSRLMHDMIVADDLVEFLTLSATSCWTDRDSSG